ncbi:MAG TPA: tetratricopeptide repeat protein [Gemmatimonadaceae bacterium]|nr:tetratricopeptide repeat protein [Gemmatimonadaceae bacterium]
MRSVRLPNRRSRRPLALAIAAGLVLVAWVGCHNGSRDAGALTSAGATHLQMREYERAIRDFDRALALNPGLVAAWRQRALAYRGKGDYERALADLEQAILLAPSDPRFYTDRGVTYELLGDYSSAIRDFSRAIAFKPNHAPALEGRGRTHFYLGNFAQAASDLQRGLALDSADAYGALWLHFARQRMRQDDREDFAAHAALVDVTKWPSPLIRYLLGELHADSLRALAATAQLDGRSQGCVVSFYLGEEALLNGEAPSAVSLFDETRTSCPKELNEHRAAVAELQRMGHPIALTGRSGSTSPAPETSAR